MATVSTEQLQWLLADVDTAHRAATSSNESQIWQRISIALNNLSEGHYAARALLQQLPSDATKSGGLGVVSQHRGSNNPISPRETGRSLQRHNTSHFEPLSPRRSFAPGTIKVPSVFAESSDSSRASDGSGNPSTTYKATTLAAGPHHFSPGSLKPPAGPVKVNLKNASAKFMSRLALFEPGLSHDQPTQPSHRQELPTEPSPQTTPDNTKVADVQPTQDSVVHAPAPVIEHKPAVEAVDDKTSSIAPKHVENAVPSHSQPTSKDQQPPVPATQAEVQPKQEEHKTSETPAEVPTTPEKSSPEKDDLSKVSVITPEGLITPNLPEPSNHDAPETPSKDKLPRISTEIAAPETPTSDSSSPSKSAVDALETDSPSPSSGKSKKLSESHENLSESATLPPPSSHKRKKSSDTLASPAAADDDSVSPRIRTSSSKKHMKSNSLKDSPRRKSLGAPIETSAITSQQTRLFIANEIVESERSYLRDLSVIIECYLTPLKSNSLIPAADVRTIFSQVEVISKISETLLKKLEVNMEAHTSKGGELKFGKPFLELCDFMKSYSMYVNNYEQAMRVLQQTKRSNKKFIKFLADAAKNDRIKSRTIEDFLIVVIQRIPRYVLLLTDLVRNTTDSNEDYTDLTKALAKVKDIADYVNQAKRRIDLLQRGVDILNAVGVKDVPAHRMFVSEEQLFESRVEGLSEKDLPKTVYNLYIFSDILVLAKHKGHDLSKVKTQDIIKSSIQEHPTDSTCLSIFLDSSYQLYATSNEVVQRVVKNWQESRSQFEKEMLALEERRKTSSMESDPNSSGFSPREERVKSPGSKRSKKDKSEKVDDT